MGKCSLVIIRNSGGRKVWDDDYTQRAEAAGVKFILLEYLESDGDSVLYALHGRGVRGFQDVTVYIGQDHGKKSNKAEWCVDESNLPCRGPRALNFEPHPETGALEAWLPDSEFNRKILAKTFYHNAQWRIVDAKIREQVKVLADGFAEKEGKTEDPTKLVLSLTDENSALQAQVARMQRELDEKALASKPKMTEERNDNREAIKKIREEIKTEVYAERPDELAALKEMKPQGWAFTKEYKKGIGAEIDRRLAERLKADGDNNATTGIDN